MNEESCIIPRTKTRRDAPTARIGLEVEHLTHAARVVTVFHVALHRGGAVALKHRAAFTQRNVHHRCVVLRASMPLRALLVHEPVAWRACSVQASVAFVRHTCARSALIVLADTTRMTGGRMCVTYVHLLTMYVHNVRISRVHGDWLTSMHRECLQDRVCIASAYQGLRGRTSSNPSRYRTYGAQTR